MVLTYSEIMQVGAEAPDFELQDFSGKNYILSKLIEGKKGLLVVFTCNHCPYAKAAWPLLVELSEKYSDVQFVAVNSNDSSEYSEDSKEGMSEMVEAQNIQFPYLVDEDQDVAKAYKAVCTPDPFLFKVENNKTSLFYHGRINDNWQHPEEVKEENLKDALEALLSGEGAPEDQPPSMGCSIKWKDEQ